MKFGVYFLFPFKFFNWLKSSDKISCTVLLVFSFEGL